MENPEIIEFNFRKPLVKPKRKYGTPSDKFPLKKSRKTKPKIKLNIETSEIKAKKPNLTFTDDWDYRTWTTK